MLFVCIHIGIITYSFRECEIFFVLFQPLNPNVDIQFQVSPPDFVHVMVRGIAELVTDQENKNRAWEIIDYDLTQFGSKGPDDPYFQPVRVNPIRVELSEMFGSVNKRVWRAS